jgi:hypothetical protein
LFDEKMKMNFLKPHYNMFFWSTMMLLKFMVVVNKGVDQILLNINNLVKKELCTIAFVKTLGFTLTLSPKWGCDNNLIEYLWVLKGNNEVQ